MSLIFMPVVPQSLYRTACKLPYNKNANNFILKLFFLKSDSQIETIVYNLNHMSLGRFFLFFRRIHITGKE